MFHDFPASHDVWRLQKDGISLIKIPVITIPIERWSPQRRHNPAFKNPKLAGCLKI